MAMSFTRPDPASPASIADASFGTGRRGFDQTEVRDFLRNVAAEFGRLQERQRFLERELEAAQASPDMASARIDDEAMTRLLGEEAMRVLTTARESGVEIRDKAEQAAAQMLSEASADAARVREEADIEASRRRTDAAADAEAELGMAKQQGREMVNEARAYRERVLSELARRRELAREQIEQLIHGRDRLMQAFERARLVAVDVVAEMQPLGEPDEYVNLAPTTGPLPVMIANSPRPDDSPADVADSPVDVTDEVADEVVDHPDDLRIIGDADDSSVGDDGEPDAADVSDDADADDAIADDVDAEEADDTSADEEIAEASTEAEDAAGDDGDDVVVDLFARLRAGDDDAADGEVVDGEVVDVATEKVEAEAEAEADSATEIVPAVDVEDAADPAEATTPSTLATDESAIAMFEARDEVTTPLIVASAKKLRRVLADEQNEVLDALRRSEAVHNLDALLPWISEHAARYSAAIAEELTEAVNAGAETSRHTTRKMRKALITASVDSANAVLEEWLVTPLRDRLAQCVTDGGGDNAAVTKKVRAVYREWKTQRIDETLDDVMRTAHGRGVLAGFDLDTPIVWETDRRQPACADCEDNMLAGAIASGTNFPTGHSYAPAHPGCTCLVAAADG